MSATTSASRPRALGARYRLERLLGRGAMGEVWLGEETASGHQVAAKLLRPEHLEDPGLVDRFVRERSILLGLRDPGIVSVTDLVVDGEDLAIVMDYLDGGSLRGVLRDRGALAPALAAGLALRVLEALAYAHAQGVVHRDVKPDNVLLASGWERCAPGDVRLSDFGVARLVGDGARTASGVLGTPAYMSPELIEHGSCGPEGDVYGAGVLLYELLAGRTPFAGAGTDFTVAHRHLTQAPPPLDVGEGLWGLLETLLAKDPLRRPGAADAAARLAGLLPDLGTRVLGDVPASAQDGESDVESDDKPDAEQDDGSDGARSQEAQDDELVPTHVPTLVRPRPLAAGGESGPGGKDDVDTESGPGAEGEAGTKEEAGTGPGPGGLARARAGLASGARRLLALRPGAAPSADSPQTEPDPEPEPPLPDLGQAPQETVVRPLPSGRQESTGSAPPAEPAAPTWRERVRRFLRGPRRRLAVVAVGLVLAGGVVLAHALWAADPGGGPGAEATVSSTPEAASASLRGQATPTGLSTDRQASVDPRTGKVVLTITYSAQSAPLTGPFLEVIPPLEEGGSCPATSWPGGKPDPNLPSVTGISTPCAWSVEAGTVPAQGVASVDVVVSLPLPATGTQAALEQWLRGAQTATQAALADPHVVSTSYPVQRLAGVDVVVASQVVTGSPLTVTLLPVWPSGADAVHPLYVSPSAGAPSTLLTAVAGGASGVSFADGCAGALVVSADGLNVVTVGAAPQCVVRARVGNLGDLVSNTFAVVGHGS